MSKPNAYRLGIYIFQMLDKNDIYVCEDLHITLMSSELEGMGAVPVESKQIEKSNIDFKSKTDWQAHLILLENKINEIIDHLQKG